MLVFLVKLSSFAKGQNSKTDIQNHKLGCAPKKYNSVISLIKKRIIAKFSSFPDIPACTESKGKNYIWMIKFYKLILLHASEIFFRISL